MPGKFVLQGMEAWKKKRTKTLIAFILVDLFLGMEYSAIMPTMYSYLTTLINSSRPMLFYGLIPASFYIANILSGILLGRISDKTRKVRLILQLGNMLILVGNLIYSLHFSSLFPLLGRIMSGFGAGVRSVIYGEMGRVYKADDFARYITIICIACAAGYGLGPLVNIGFKNVNLDICGWHLNYTNMPGVYLAIIFGVNQIIFFFMVHDLSLEKEYIEESSDNESLSKCDSFDSEECLKSMEPIETIKNSESKCSAESMPLIDDVSGEDSLEKSKNTNYSVPSQSFIWKSLLKSIDWILLMTLTFFFGLTVFANEMWFPLIVINDLQYGVAVLNGVLLEIGIVMIPVLLLMAWKPPSKKLVFIFYVIGIILQMSGFLILLALKMFHNNNVLNIVLLGTYGAFCSTSPYMKQLPKITIAQMVPKSSQGYVQGILQAFSRFGAFLGIFLPPQLYNWFSIDVIVIVMVSVMLLFALVIRRANIIRPRVLFT